MNTNHPSKSNGPKTSEAGNSASSNQLAGKVTGKRDEITKLRCATDRMPWEHPIEEFAAWIDDEIVRLETRFAQYSTVSGRRKSFSR